MASLSMSIFTVSRRNTPRAGALVLIKRWLTLASFAPTTAGGISETLFSLPAVSCFFFFLFRSAQPPYGGADSSPAGWSRVVWRERSDPARQAQPAKVLGPKLSFCADAGTAVCCRTPCYTSQRTVERRLDAGRESRGGVGEGGREGGRRLNFHSRLRGGTEVKSSEMISGFCTFGKLM